MEDINEMGHLASPEKERRVVVVRHFDEIDDLEQYGRDAVLREGQEDKAEKVAGLLFDEIRERNKKAVLFVTSPKIRAKQTAQMVIEALINKDHTLKCSCVQEEDLRAIDQGEFILPSDYIKGQKSEGLSIADQIFLDETHASENGEKEDNYDYRYGDPVLLENGQYRFPELNRFFVRYGETYRDVLIRLYSLVVKMSEKIDKLGKNTELVIVAHGQPAQIFKDLKMVALLVGNNVIEYKEGGLAKLCWDLYKRRGDSEKVTSIADVISVEELTDSRLVELLKNEVLFLKNK